MGTAFWIRGVVVVLFSIIGVASVVVLQSQSNPQQQVRGSIKLLEPIDNLLNPNNIPIENIQVPVAPQPVPTFTPVHIATATFTPVPTATPTPTNTPVPTTAAVVIQQPTAAPVVVVELQPTSTPNPNDPNVVCNNLTTQKEQETCWWRWQNDLPLIEEPTPTPVLLPSPTPIIVALPPTPTPAPQILVVQPSRITYKVRPDSDVLREIFKDDRFQKALSHAINCNEINHAVYHGRANLQQLCQNDEYNLDRSHQLLDEIGLAWDPPGVYRMRPDGEVVSWAVESINNNQQTNDILKLCMKHFESIGVNMVVKQINEPATTIPPHAIVTTAMGSGICVDWVSLFAQSPKAPCTTQAESDYLLSGSAGTSVSSIAYLLFTIDEVLYFYHQEDMHHPYEELFALPEYAKLSHNELQLALPTYEKILHRPLARIMLSVKHFEQVVPPQSMQVVHARREKDAQTWLTIHNMLRNMLEEKEYNHEDADAITFYAEILGERINEEWDMIEQMCDYYQSSSALGPHGLIGTRNFFDDLD